MGYFEGISNLYFKSDSGGKQVFYPWGVFGKGYVLPDAAAEGKLRRFIRVHLMVAFPVIIVAVIQGWGWCVIACAGLFAWFYIGSRRHLAGCQVSSERLTLKESYSNSAKAHNLVTLWVLFIIALFFTFVPFWLATGEPVNSSRLMLILSGLLFGCFSFAIGYMIKVKMMANKE